MFREGQLGHHAESTGLFGCELCQLGIFWSRPSTPFRDHTLVKTIPNLSPTLILV